VLVVTALPDPESAIGGIVHALEDGLVSDGRTSVTVHDLISTGFNPVFGPADLRSYRAGRNSEEVPSPADVLAEQKLIETADSVILAFPVHWWSLPSLLKGWIDRVFTRGWAYENAGKGETPVRGLYFIALAAFGQEPFERRGYKTAMATVLHEGIAKYINATHTGLYNLYESESTDPAVHAELVRQAREIGTTIATTLSARPEQKAASSTKD